MNDLEQYFYNNPGRVIHKWRHYFEIYDRHFSRYRGRPVTIVEIGVYKGGSLQMWKHYFGPQARLYGIDIDPACQAFGEERIDIVIGSQEDRDFLRFVRERIPHVDILIDDGGHTMRQQIVTFEELFPHVAPNGVYLCEDLHTSYWREYGGGYRAPDTFIEYSKNFVDYIHAWHAQAPMPAQTPRRAKWYKRWYKSVPPEISAPELSESDFTRSAHSLHFYDSVLVIEKRPMERPSDTKTGSDIDSAATGASVQG